MTTVVLREGTVTALNHAYPDLLPKMVERKARGRGYQCVFEISDVPALVVKLQALTHSTDSLAKANAKADLTKFKTETPKPVASKPTATAATPVAESEPLEPELIRVSYDTHHAFTCTKCRKGWDIRGAAHCQVCHVTFGDAEAMLAHNTGEHLKFRPCLHPSELAVRDNGDDVWVSAA